MNKQRDGPARTVDTLGAILTENKDQHQSPLTAPKTSDLAAISNLTNPNHPNTAFPSPRMAPHCGVADYSDFLAEDQRAATQTNEHLHSNGQIEHPDGIPTSMAISTPEISSKTFEKFLSDPAFGPLGPGELLARSGMVPLPAEVGSSFVGVTSPPENTMGRGTSSRAIEDSHSGLGATLAMGDDIMGQYAKFFDPSMAGDNTISKTLVSTPNDWETTRSDRSAIMDKVNSDVLPLQGQKSMIPQFGLGQQDGMIPTIPALPNLGPPLSDRKSFPKKKNPAKVGQSPPKPPPVAKTIKKGNERSGGLSKNSSGKKFKDSDDADSESFDAFEDMCSIGSKEKLSDDERKRRRAESNRLSAERSRERRKLHLKSLEAAVMTSQTEKQDAKSTLTFYQQQITVLQEIIQLQGSTEQKVAAEAVSAAVQRYQRERPQLISNIMNVSNQVPVLNSPLTSASLGSSSPSNVMHR